jgi:preprotein translocase subunit SecA
MDHAGNNEKISEDSAKELLENIQTNLFNINLKPSQLLDLTPDEIVKEITDKLNKTYEEKIKEVPKEIVNEFEKAIYLRVIDSLWMEHINTMEQLEEGIQLRSYAQENPLQAYMIEGYKLFDQLLDQIEHDVTIFLLKAEIRQKIERQQVEKPVATNHQEETKQQPKKTTKVGRNEPCPCGSGKKYKQCHGK